MAKCKYCGEDHKNDNTGCYNSGDGNPGDWNSGNWNSGNKNSGDWNSGNWNSGNKNSGDSNSGNWNSGNKNSGDSNSGNWNSGNKNSGNWNSGIFNTNEPKMRAFNKECDLTYTEFREKFGYKDIEFPLNVWICKEDMTDEEKKNNKDWKTMGGYLKTLPYKEAWKEGWKNATQEQKDWYKSLPNFDAKIFEEITGINIAELEEMIEIDGKKVNKATISEALKEYFN